ncbi:MAG TPA: hypothetical protein VMT71_15455 [Syntrophorhabdales bacterium]|nr:hypothetical protein [Syntrophorhabdales bacterium]
MAASDRTSITLTCGKCGSKAVVSEKEHSNAITQRISAIRCLICGNRQEPGAPCRWPFFDEKAAA